MGSALLKHAVGASALLALALSSIPAAADDTCPDRDGRLDLIEAAERSLVEADVDTSEEKLRDLEAALGCGPVVDVDLLARMWLVEAALLTLGGDTETAAASWVAAGRAAPDIWNANFGDMLRAEYERATAAGANPGRTPLSIEPELFRWIGAVDGEVISRFPVTIEPGLHLVQVGASEDDVRFSRFVVAFADTPVVVVTGLVEPTTVVPDPVPTTPAPNTPEPPPPPVEHPPVALHVAVGAALGVGRPSDTSDEPAVKVVVPIETGAVVRPINAAWIRGALRAGPLLTGEYAYSDDLGNSTSPATLGFHLAGGLAARQGDLGLLAGWSWPGRLAFRGTVAVQLGAAPVRVEGRLGMDVPTSAAPETAFDVMLAFQPRIVRHREGFGDGEAAAE